MEWTYVEFDTGSSSDIANELLAALNSYSESARAGAKLCASDQKSGAARGVIFVCPDFPDEEIRAPRGEWGLALFTTSGDYENDLYEPAAAHLSRLSPELAFWAQATFTNYQGGDATLGIYYPMEP